MKTKCSLHATFEIRLSMPSYKRKQFTVNPPSRTSVVSSVFCNIWFLLRFASFHEYFFSVRYAGKYFSIKLASSRRNKKSKRWWTSNSFLRCEIFSCWLFKELGGSSTKLILVEIQSLHVQRIAELWLHCARCSRFNFLSNMCNWERTRTNVNVNLYRIATTVHITSVSPPPRSTIYFRAFVIKADT